MDHGLDDERLMENAGCAAAAAIRRVEEVSGKFVTIFCGCGNNGGDGLVVARRLAEAGANVVAVLTDGTPRSDQAKSMLERAAAAEIPLIAYGDDPAYLTERLSETDLLVDAIYGSGFHGTLDDLHHDICRLLNGVGAAIVSLDIPSGVAADTGAADESAIRAAYTVVFDSYKPATVMPAAEKYCGKVLLADIGIPREALDSIFPLYFLMEEQLVFDVLKKRARDSHKGDYGRLLNIAGCQQYMGAAVLSSLAAMRTGAGYVTLASTKEVCRTVLPSLPEAVLMPLQQTPEGGISYKEMDTILEAAQSADAVLVGNGLGTSEDACRIVYTLIKELSCPLIVDADGINVISRNIDILKQSGCPILLTPHLKELSRLTTLPMEQLRADPLTAGLAFAREYGVHLILKGAYTTTVNSEGQVWINTTGNPGLAKAGSGDVLAGIVGSLAAQGYHPDQAAACGAWIHGLAGDYAARVCSQYGMLARDVIDSLCDVFADYQL